MLGNRKERNQVQCRDFRELADSYLSDELLIETNHDLLRHLEKCGDCREELASRRELRRKLRDGFQQAPDLQMSDEFANRLKDQLRETVLLRSHSQVPRYAAYIAVAAALVIAAAIGFRIVQEGWRSQQPPTVIGGVNPEEKPERDRNRSDLVNAAFTESVIGDHRDCALNHRLEEKPISLDDAGRKYDRAYINLVSAVMSEEALPVGVELVDGHSCVFKGRRFGHVILKYQDQLISVLVTSTEAGDQGTPTPGEELIASAQSDGFRMAHFETDRHAVYVVSSLNDTENLSIARAIAPSVSKHIRDAERIA
jgi:anti-sigma factor RsiW